MLRAARVCGATAITEGMKMACAMALSDLARSGDPEGEHPVFGPDYLIPDVLDPRILPIVAGAVAAAATMSNVATRPIADIAAYQRHLATAYTPVIPSKPRKAPLRVAACM
jgi:malic enzyme